MGRRIVIPAGRPEFWLGLLLVETLLSALRSWHTPWARVAGTEALRWGAGLALTLALGRGLPRLRLATQALTVLLAALVLSTLAAGVGPTGMITGPFRDHQLCAGALLLLLPFAVALALTADTPAWRWGAQVIALAAAVCLALTQTRSAWLGGMAASLVFAGLWLRLSPSSAIPRRVHAWVIPVLLVVAVGGAFALLASSANLGDPLAARARTLQSVGQDGSWRARIQTWRGALHMAATQPLLGVGLGRYPGAQWVWTHQGRPLSPDQRPSLSEQAHNLYLQTVVETGAVGLALYGAALGTLAACCRRALCRPSVTRRRGLPQALSVATLSVLAGQGVDALASPSYQFSEVSLLFWACLGLGLAAVNRREAAESVVVLPPTLRHALRFCAVGAGFLTLLAQILPIGLLTPVEAYDSPSGWTLSALTITAPQASVSAPSRGVTQLVYGLTANYTSGSGSSAINLVTIKDTTYKFTVSAVYTANGQAVTPNSVFSGGNTLNVAAGDKSKTLTITASFVDKGVTYTSASPVTLVVN